LGRREEIHFIVFLIYFFPAMSERSWIHRNSHHILSDKFRSIASLSTLIYYYIVISLHNNIYCSTHQHYVLLVSIYFLLRISTSLRHFVQDFCVCCRSRYLRSGGWFIPLFPLQATLGFGAVHTQLRHVGCSNTLVLGCFNARLAQHFSSIHFDSLTHFIPLCIIHFELLIHS